MNLNFQNEISIMLLIIDEHILYSFFIAAYWMSVLIFHDFIVLFMSLVRFWHEQKILIF